MDFAEFPDLAGGEDRLPPAEVRFTELRAEPWPDGRRVRVHVQVTPFQQRPNLEISIQNAAGEEVSSVSLIEILTTRFVITLHIRGPEIEGQFSLHGRLYYPDLETVDQLSAPFAIHPEQPPPSADRPQSP